jgi:hypothetical protein
MKNEGGGIGSKVRRDRKREALREQPSLWPSGEVVGPQAWALSVVGEPAPSAGRHCGQCARVRRGLPQVPLRAVSATAPSAKQSLIVSSVSATAFRPQRQRAACDADACFSRKAAAGWCRSARQSHQDSATGPVISGRENARLMARQANGSTTA